MSTLVFDELRKRPKQNRLKHYGVKGMRWGFSSRKGTSGSKSSGDSDKVEVADDYLKARVARSKPPAALSNKEMQELITRMELEQKYVRLTADPPPAPRPATKTGKAAKFVSDLMLQVGQEQVTRIARASGNRAGNKFAQNRLKGLDVVKELKKPK